MRLAFDTVGARFGGTAVVAHEVVAASLRCAGVDHVTVFATARPERQFDFPRDSRIEVIEVGRLAASGLGRAPWQLATLARNARKQGAELLIGLSNGGVGTAELPAAIFVQQALPFMPAVLAGQPLALQVRMRLARSVMKRSAKRAVAIGVQTEAMRNAVVQAFSLPPERVLVFLPPAPMFPPAEIHGNGSRAIAGTPRGQRVLYVGSSLAYKNVELAVAATTLAGAVLFATADTGTTLPGVVQLSNLTRGELRAAYEGCDVLVMTSRAESLGLPLLEAMSLGLPIVTVDKPYAREVCHTAALYVPESATQIADAIRSVLDSPQLRDELITKGKRRIAALEAAQPYEAMIRTFMHAAGRRGVE